MKKPKTIVEKILHVCLLGCEMMSQREFNNVIEKRFGKAARKISTSLWKDGCFNINQYGYVNLSGRGYRYYDTGILPPKRSPKKQPTTAQYLDYMWNSKSRRKDFEAWLKSKGVVSLHSKETPE